MKKPIYSSELGSKQAFRVHEKIAHLVDKFMLVGSLGRKESRICDVDILVIPTDIHDIPSIRTELRMMGEWKRGGSRNMVVENIFKSGLNLDLYLCHPPAQWGVLTAVRLNPAPLVIEGKRRIDNAGLTRKGGTIFDGTRELRIAEEVDWFDLIGIKFVPPWKRWELTRDLRLI